MSYCRIGEASDVYVIRNFDHHGGGLTCFHTDSNSFHCDTEQQMINHLAAHVLSGQQVPQRAFDRLEAERDGRPWRTDVELALDNLDLDAIGVESPVDLLVDNPEEES